MAEVSWPGFVLHKGQRFDLVAQWRREWTCRVHDRPEPYPDEWDEEIEFDWPVYGCTCHKDAYWRAIVGELEFILDATLHKILKAFYLPAITKQLNEESLFLKALAGE